MYKTTYSAVGIDPSAQVVGSSVAHSKLLLRAKTTQGRTQRYVACYDSDDKFRFFRRVSSSERKRLGRGEDITCPLELLDWKQGSCHWVSQWGTLKVITLTPSNLLAPTDYSTYVVNGEMVSNHTLKEILTNEDHNH